jgi:uncharacterized membrane protein
MFIANLSSVQKSIPMNALAITLRLIHILAGVYWAGTIFFFMTFLEPSLRSLGPDGGKVMIRMLERGYMKVLPIIATLTVVSGLWLLWILSGGFDPTYMASPVGMALSTGGGFAILAWLIGIFYIRPAGARIWEIANTMPQADESRKNALNAELAKARSRTTTGGRLVFGLLIASVALMAIARYTN